MGGNLHFSDENWLWSGGVLEGAFFEEFDGYLDIVKNDDGLVENGDGGYWACGGGLFVRVS